MVDADRTGRVGHRADQSKGPHLRFDLPEENAAVISALVRLNVDAIGDWSCGSLNDDEMRMIGERIINVYGFDPRLLVDRRIKQLAARRRSGRG